MREAVGLFRELTFLGAKATKWMLQQVRAQNSLCSDIEELVHLWTWQCYIHSLISTLSVCPRARSDAQLHLPGTAISVLPVRSLLATREPAAGRAHHAQHCMLCKD